MDETMDDLQESQELAQETPAEDVFIAPSIHKDQLITGVSYTHASAVPEALKADMSIECVLGVDEAGRGPVLGPMVYGLYYLPLALHRSLLAETHHFDDSKVLSATFRSSLMQAICTPGTDLYQSCGWSTRVMSARDISSDQLRCNGMYNLNAQAMDATIQLIRDAFATGVNIKEIYIDTIGQPAPYQKKLERIFPTAQVTVAKKADSLYPCVSAASVCAKVTRDAALEVCYESFKENMLLLQGQDSTVGENWGSGYPGDARTSTWLKSNMDALFGWGNECRFSWATAKDMLDAKPGAKVTWPVPDDDENTKLTEFFLNSTEASSAPAETGLGSWFGRKVTEEVF